MAGIGCVIERRPPWHTPPTTALSAWQGGSAQGTGGRAAGALVVEEVEFLLPELDGALLEVRLEQELVRGKHPSPAPRSPPLPSDARLSREVCRAPRCKSSRSLIIIITY